MVVFVDIELYVKFGDEWSRPIHGTGGGKLISKEAKGLNVSDECYKMATTDALSVACKQLGIGADVYWDKDQNGRNYSSAPASSAPHFPDPEQKSSKLPDPKQKSGTAGKAASPILEERYVNSLWKELKRTGVGVNSLLRNYKKCSIQELSFEEYKDAMNKLTAKPDKPLDPAFVPPDDEGEEPEGLPWNSKDQENKKEGKIAPVQEAGKKKALSPWPLPTALAEDGYSYCESFGGN